MPPILYPCTLTHMAFLTTTARVYVMSLQALEIIRICRCTSSKIARFTMPRIRVLATTGSILAQTRQEKRRCTGRYTRRLRPWHVTLLGDELRVVTVTRPEEGENNNTNFLGWHCIKTGLVWSAARVELQIAAQSMQTETMVF